MDERKKKFAELLLKEGNPFQAALAVFPPEQLGDALQIAEQWAEDVEVKRYCEQIVKQVGDKAVLPAKETIVREVLALGRITDAEMRARLAAYRLIAEVCGYIEKPSPQVNVNQNNMYRVMQMPNHGTDEEWERKAVEQQQRLLEDARATKH